MTSRTSVDPDHAGPNAYVVVDAEKPGAGKTSVASAFAAAMRAQGLKVGGVLMRRVYNEDGASSELIGYDAHLLSTDQTLPLVRRPHNPKFGQPVIMGDTRGEKHGSANRYSLLKANGLEVLQRLKEDHDDPTIDVFVLDEIGPILSQYQERKGRQLTVSALHEDLLHHPKLITLVTIFYKTSMFRAKIEAHQALQREDVAHAGRAALRYVLRGESVGSIVSAILRDVETTVNHGLPASRKVIRS